MPIRDLIFESWRRIMGSYSSGSSPMSSASKMELMWSETLPFCGARSGLRCRRGTVEGRHILVSKEESAHVDTPQSSQQHARCRLGAGHTTRAAGGGAAHATAGAHDRRFADSHVEGEHAGSAL